MLTIVLLLLLLAVLIVVQTALHMEDIGRLRARALTQAQDGIAFDTMLRLRIYFIMATLSVACALVTAFLVPAKVIWVAFRVRNGLQGKTLREHWRSLPV